MIGVRKNCNFERNETVKFQDRSLNRPLVFPGTAPWTAKQFLCMIKALVKSFFLTFIMLSVHFPICASEPPGTVFPDADKVVAQRILNALWKEKSESMKSSGSQTGDAFSKLILSAAGKLAGTPYAGGTLDSEWEGEQMRIFLTRTDCILFVQTCISLAQTVDSATDDKDVSIERFASLLERSRYRKKGPPYSYSDRIHYTTEWLRREEGATLNDITIDLGGSQIDHPVSFMTSNASRYPLLSDQAINPDCESDLKAIRATEEKLNREPMTTIPGSKLPEAAKGIRSGDIICFTTTVEGLDISHVAIAVVKNGEVFFIHASQKEGKVIVDKKPLIEYVNVHRNLSGVKILRPLGR